MRKLTQKIDTFLNEASVREVQTNFNEFHASWLKLQASLQKYLLPDERAELERVRKQMNNAIDYLADLTD
jgi:hypothetical protein